jgi:hypothetical protein
VVDGELPMTVRLPARNFNVFPGQCNRMAISTGAVEPPLAAK